MNPTTSKTTPKDFFVQAAVTLTLYVSIISLISLYFDIINHYFVDALSYDAGTYSIRLCISMLVVLLPLTYILELIIRKDIVKDPSKNDIWIRKWRIYLTLFLSVATIATDLIVLINTYLGGEISTRFIFKIIVVLIISGIVFALFLLEKGGQENTFWTRRWLRILIGIIALAAIVTGFIAVGTPATQRELAFDTQRISDLSNIQSQVILYWQRNNNLPNNLFGIFGQYVNIPVDPDTKASYVYNVKGEMNFELCATFSLSSDVEASQETYPDYGVVSGSTQSWTHPAGYFCFERTVDPSLYPSMAAPLSSTTPPQQI